MQIFVFSVQMGFRTVVLLQYMHVFVKGVGDEWIKGGSVNL